MQRFLSVMFMLTLMLMPIVASCGPQQPDLAQLTRMRTETADARVLESIGCISRDWVCAEIVALRGEACAEAALAIFDGWRGALGANDPAVDPAGLDGAVNDLRAIPGGEPYAATLQAARLTKLARAAPGAGACDILVGELAALPSAPPPMLQPRVAIERDTAVELSSKRGCSS